MNSSRYVPFERNRYFYGKLLTVRDFLSEQTYLSDKRRMANRLLYGSGVISGLQVIAVDDKSVSIETGAALDQMGREIVVPSPLTLKLSNIEGFKNNDYARNIYLCIAYDEKGKEPVHAVAGSLHDEEVSEHNRILESYRLFIHEQPLEPAMQEYEHLITDTSVWYDDGLVRILQSVPRYIEPGQTFDLCITIEKTLQTPHIEFEYEPEWLGVEVLDELIDGKIIFSEPTDGGLTTYTKTIRMRANSIPEGLSKQLGSVAAKAGTTRLVVGDKLNNELTQIKQVIEVSEEPAEQRMFHAYHSRSLDRAMESPAEPCVYLAKINLLQMGATYVIDRVESLPFQQYIMNPTMLYKILSSQEKAPLEAAEVAKDSVGATQANDVEFPSIKDEFSALLHDSEDTDQEQYVATGLAEISIVPLEKKKWYQRRKKDFYSVEIEHGLEAGAVLLSAGLSDVQEETDIILPEMWNRSNAIFSGQQDIFNGSEYASDFPNVSIGFIQHPKKGTFRLGVRIHQKTERTKITVRWWAVKPMMDKVGTDNSDDMLEQMEQGMAQASPSKT